MESELLMKIEAMQDASADMAKNAPMMFKGAVGPVTEMVDGILELLVELAVAVEDLREVH